MPAHRADTRYFFNTHRQRVDGIFRDAADRRRYRKLATFSEAHIDEHGNSLPDWTDAQRDAFLVPRYLSAQQALAQSDERAKTAGHDRKIRDALREWIIASKAWRAEGTIEGYTLFQEQYLNAVGNHPLADFEDDEIWRKHLDAFVAALRKRKIKKSGAPLSPHSINNRLNSLKAFLRYLAEHKAIAQQPRFRLVSAPSRDPAVWDFADLGRMWDAMVDRLNKARNFRERQSARCGMRAMSLAMGTGCRASEVWAPPWSFLDLTDPEGLNAWVDVRELPHFLPKGGIEKRCSIAQRSALFLRNERLTCDKEVWFLDDAHGGMMFSDPNSLSNYFGGIQRGLGINRKAKTFHGFRAWYITSALARGVDLVSISRQVGHRNVNTTARYAGRVAQFKQFAASQVSLELMPNSFQSFLLPITPI